MKLIYTTEDGEEQRLDVSSMSTEEIRAIISDVESSGSDDIIVAKGDSPTLPVAETVAAGIAGLAVGGPIGLVMGSGLGAIYGLMKYSHELDDVESFHDYVATSEGGDQNVN